MWMRYFSLWCKKYIELLHWILLENLWGPQWTPRIIPISHPISDGLAKYTCVFVLRGECRCAWFSWWMIVSLFSPPVCSVCTLCSLMSSCRRLSIRPAHWLGIVCCDLCLMNEIKLMPACLPSLWPCVCLCETRFCTCFELKRCNTTQTVSSEKLSMMKQQLSSVNPSKLSDH